jgi:hypothetical protein
MRKALCLVAFAAFLLVGYGDAGATHQPGGATTACCKAVPCQQTDTDSACDNPNGGWACSEDGNNTFPSQPDGNGCQESSSGCIAGSAGAGGVQGCVCVGTVCVSGPVVPPGVPPIPGTTAADCTLNAVIGCRKVPGGAHCTNGGGCGP